MTTFTILVRRGVYYYRQRTWPSGTYRSLSIPADGTKDAQKRVWDAAEAEFRKSSEASKGTMRLRDYAKRFYGPNCPHVASLLADGRTVSDRVLTQQESIVKRDLMPLAVMSVRVCDLRSKDTRGARAEILQTKGSTRSAQRAFAILRTILRTAYEHELVTSDPTAGVSGIKYKAEPRSDFTPEQTEAFFRRENFRSDAAWALFRLAYLTGMRRSEVCALDRSQDQGGALRVDRAYKDAEFKVVGLPKWDKTRSIVITKPIRDLLDWWYAKTPFVHDGPVFPMATPGFWKREFGYALSAAGITGVVPHSLRHTLASDLADEGVSPDVIRETLGHGDEKIRARYTHLRRDRVSAEMEGAMQRIVGGAK